MLETPLPQGIEPIATNAETNPLPSSKDILTIANGMTYQEREQKLEVVKNLAKQALTGDEVQSEYARGVLMEILRTSSSQPEEIYEIESKYKDEETGKPFTSKETNNSWVSQIHDEALFSLAMEARGFNVQLNRPLEADFYIAVINRLKEDSRHIGSKDEYSHKQVMKNAFIFLDTLTRPKITYANGAKSNLPSLLVSFISSDAALRTIFTRELTKENAYYIAQMLEQVASIKNLQQDSATGLFTSPRRKLYELIQTDKKLRQELKNYLTQPENKKERFVSNIKEILNPEEMKQEVIAQNIVNALGAIPLVRKVDGIDKPVDIHNPFDLLGYAYEELKNIRGGTESNHKIVKAFLLSTLAEISQEQAWAVGMTKAMYKDRVTSGQNFFRSMFVNLVTTNPEILGNLAVPLREFLSLYNKPQYPYEAAEKEILKLRQNDPISVEEGDSDHQEKLQSLLDSNAPIVWYLRTGKGDTFLSLALIGDLLSSLDKKGLQNKILMMMDPALIDTINALYPEAVEKGQLILQEYPNTLDKSEQGFEQNYAEARDMIEAFVKKSNAHLSSEDKNKGIFLYYGNWKYYPYTPSHNRPDELVPATYGEVQQISPPSETSILTDSFRSSMQIQMSVEFGRVLFDPRAREDDKQVRERFRSYLDAYADNHPDLKEEIETTKNDMGGKYIALVGEGSTPIKSLTPDTAEQIAKQFKEQGLGFVYISTRTDEMDRVNQIGEVFRQQGVKFKVVQIKSTIEDSLVWLSQASGVIGPDTALIHAASYFSIPVLNILMDSDALSWRVDKNVIAAEHPFALFLRKQNIHYDPWGLNYLTLISGTYPMESASRVHPLLKSVQNSYFKDLEEKLRVFRRRVART